ncbi:GNAT family N-acetyltransferase [Xanthomonas nasturtii]|nr:GNAT family N-acetyltransferase [Xanthomonas nasturtii]MCL1526427.1 GNAT family N-acetyltransferase [Xanthomonas nasturtii]MCL1533922.1 GNAT family N-acetyltransferase [Xanthomonas nasturtii]MCL1543590.1 GNAT family N-acetyltransferase [Xanthomonas nasturtii]
MQDDADASTSVHAGVVPPHALSAHGISLRPEQGDDLAWLRDLYASTRHDEMTQVPWPDTTKRAFLEQQFDLQRTHYRHHFADAAFLIVQVRELRTGRLYLHRTATQHTLVDISLLPDRRGKGIGSHLIAYAQASARAASCALCLHVLHANRAAQRLYVRHGFVAGHSTQTHLQMHWNPHAQLLS